jgi:hypothetical protein
MRDFPFAAFADLSPPPVLNAASHHRILFTFGTSVVAGAFVSLDKGGDGDDDGFVGVPVGGDDDDVGVVDDNARVLIASGRSPFFGAIRERTRCIKPVVTYSRCGV